MNAFATALRNHANVTRTDNGALTPATTNSAVLDLFASGAAWRSRSEADVIRNFELAFAEDKELAVKCLFYIRDIRQGQGERETFRRILRHLYKSHKEVFDKVAVHVPEFGRWDDIFEYIQEPVISGALLAQLQSDSTSERPSLLAKWLPSERTASKKSAALAQNLFKLWAWKPRKYRKTIVAIRKKLKLVENALQRNALQEINYEHVPSRAALRYRKTFKGKDGERYAGFLAAVKSGKAKIKTATLYPYDLVHAIWGKGPDETVEAQWASLPNYFSRPTNVLVMCDTSASMQSPNNRPMEVARSLAIYVAERNTGAFKNLYMTFSKEPQLVEISGNDLFGKVNGFKSIVENTDLMKAFREIIKYAKHSNARQEDLPEMLVVISDMEFDAAVVGPKMSHQSGPMTYGNNNRNLNVWVQQAVLGYDYMGRPILGQAPSAPPEVFEETNFELAKKEFEAAGYVMPLVVFWNVNAQNDHQPVRRDERGVMLVSGCSPTILDQVLQMDWDRRAPEPPLLPTPMELCLAKLNSERYAAITLK